MHLIVLFVLLMANVSLAATTVDENFDDATIASPLSIYQPGGYCTTGCDYTTAVRRGTSGYSVRGDHSVGDVMMMYNNFATHFDEGIYFRYYLYVPSSYLWPGEGGVFENWKMAKFAGDDEDIEFIYKNSSSGAPTNLQLYWKGADGTTAGNGTGTGNTTMGGMFTSNNWNKIEIYVKAGTSYAEQGIHVQVNDYDVYEDSGTDVNFLLPASAYTGAQQFMSIRASNSPPSGQGTYYIDDVTIVWNEGDLCDSEPGGADTSPPNISGGSPSGTLAAGTTTSTLAVGTGENATCRYSTSSGVAYASMTNTFGTTGGTSHSQSLSGLTNGSSYSYYVRCIDSSGNANASDYTVSFSVAASAATCAEDNDLCTSEADCSTYWPSYHWCGGDLPVCQAAECPASCDASHYHLCSTELACEAAGHYWWESACRTISEVGGSGNLLTNPFPATWSSGLPSSWTTYVTTGIAQDAALGVRLSNGGTMAQLTLTEGSTYRWVANLKVVTAGQFEVWRYDQSELFSVVGTVTGTFTVPVGAPDRKVYFKAPAGDNDVIAGDFVVREITSGISGASLSGTSAASLSGPTGARLQ